MKYKWKHRLIVWILTIALMLTLPVAALADGETPDPNPDPDPAPSETSTALDLTKTVDLTIAPGPPSMTGSEHPTRLPAANVVYDVYKVAKAVKETGMESYHFQLEPAFEGILPSGMDISTYTGLKAMDNAKWHEIAMAAAAKIFGGSFTGSPVVSTADTMTLDAGLYLVIARSSNLTDEADYVKWDEDTDPKTLIGTIARSAEYEYTYAPELIALPAAREEIPAVFPGDADPNYITGNDWYYTVSAMLKPQEEIRYGDLKVVKDLIVYNTNASTTDPVSFVFRVNWQKINDIGQDEGTGDAILMLTFTGTGVKSSLIEGVIPVGAKVKVEEIYTGAGYVNTTPLVVGGLGEDNTDFVILAPEDDNAPLTATFADKCDNEQIKGYGILNQYSYDNGGWVVDNAHDSGE